MAKRSRTASSKKSSKPELLSLRMGAGCLTLFAMPFALVGIGMLALALNDWRAWIVVQDWVEIPATLLQADLKANRDGDGGDSFEATARYQYEFAGKQYEGNRVGLHSGSDNIGSYQRDRARELEATLKAGGKFRCFVDPRQPEESILFRELRPGMLAFKLLFAFIFGGAGCGLIAMCWLGYRKAKRQEKFAWRYPDQPWRWREEWLAGRIRSSAGFLPWFVGCFALAWNAISWFVFIAVWSTGEHDEKDAPLLLLALFPALGVAMAAWAVYLWLRRWKWGTSEFELASMPGVLGGPLAGIVHAPAGIESECCYLLKLACIRRTMIQRRGESETQDITEWEETQTIADERTMSDGRRTLIPVQFIVPYDLPPSGDEVRWMLIVSAATTGIDYHAEFNVPVFKTELSSPAPRADGAAALASAPATDDFAAVVERMGGRIAQEAADGRVIVFPMARHKGMAVFLVIFCTVWTAVCAGLFKSSAPRIFPWVFSLFDLIIIYATVSSCLTSTRLELGGRGVAITRRTLGIESRREYRTEEIAEVIAEKSGSTYGSAVFRHVALRTFEGKQRTLVGDIPRAADAERLKQEIVAAVGLSQSRSDDESSRMALESELPAELRGE